MCVRSDERMHVLAGEKPANLAQAGNPRLSENSKDSPLNFTSSGRLGDKHDFLSKAQSRLGEKLSPEREFDEILAVVTVGPSPRREGVA